MSKYNPLGRNKKWKSTNLTYPYRVYMNLAVLKRKFELTPIFSENQKNQIETGCKIVSGPLSGYFQAAGRFWNQTAKREATQM